MAYPMRLHSWWEVIFLLVFVFIIGMSEFNLFWKEWGGPILIAMFVFVVIAVTRNDARQ